MLHCELHETPLHHWRLDRAARLAPVLRLIAARRLRQRPPAAVRRADGCRVLRCRAGTRVEAAARAQDEELPVCVDPADNAPLSLGETEDRRRCTLHGVDERREAAPSRLRRTEDGCQARTRPPGAPFNRCSKSSMKSSEAA